MISKNPYYPKKEINSQTYARMRKYVKSTRPYLEVHHLPQVHTSTHRYTHYIKHVRMYLPRRTAVSSSLIGADRQESRGGSRDPRATPEPERVKSTPRPFKCLHLDSTGAW